MGQLEEFKIGKSLITKLSFDDHEHSADSVFKSWLNSNFLFIDGDFVGIYYKHGKKIREFFN